MSDIRTALGPHRDILLTDGSVVSLDRDRIKIDFSTPPVDSHVTLRADVFEGLDEIKDREFEHLLRDIRMLLGKNSHTVPDFTAPRSDKPVIILEFVSGDESDNQLILQLARDRLHNQLSEHDIIVIAGTGFVLESSNRNRNCVALRVCVNSADDATYMSFSTFLPTSGMQLWSEGALVPALFADAATSLSFDRFCFRASEKVLDAISDPKSELSATQFASVLARRAHRRIFQLDWDSLASADQLLQRAFEITPHGAHLAWRAFLRNLAFFQHRRLDFGQGASLQELAVEAYRYSPESVTVQAIASQLEYVHEGDTRTSLQLSQSAVNANASNPLSWAMYSNALAVNGAQTDSYAAAERSVRLATGSYQQFFFEHFACMAAASLAEYDKALAHARMALFMKPEFVSVRRYEIALTLRQHHAPASDRSITSMQRYEPDFTASKFLDPTYPVTTLRRLPLMEEIQQPSGF
nr:hypothetical protein [Roseibium aggregatum]